MTLDERLRARLQPLGAIDKKMFGGTCFMLDGNMLIGTLKKGLIVRVGKDAHAAAISRPGARTFDMTGRLMLGYVTVEGTPLADDGTLDEWVGLALAHVKRLPPKLDKKKSVSPGKNARAKSR
jgi:TfoX/Sxy family transcriptional regulator of competence genes